MDPTPLHLAFLAVAGVAAGILGTAGGITSLIAYPALLDPVAQGRNFDDVGETAALFYATLATQGCEVTSDRDLVRRPVAIKVWP